MTVTARSRRLWTAGAGVATLAPGGTAVSAASSGYGIEIAPAMTIETSPAGRETRARPDAAAERIERVEANIGFS